MPCICFYFWQIVRRNSCEQECNPTVKCKVTSPDSGTPGVRQRTLVPSLLATAHRFKGRKRKEREGGKGREGARQWTVTTEEHRGKRFTRGGGRLRLAGSWINCSLVQQCSIYSDYLHVKCAVPGRPWACEMCPLANHLVCPLRHFK